MYNLIRKAAESYERSAPRDILLGTKVAVVGVVVAFGGAAIMWFVSESVGSNIAPIGILIGLVGMFMYAIGFIKYIARGRKEAKEAMERIENPKQPWES